MPEKKDKKKKQSAVKPSPKSMSRGQKRYMLASDVKEASESYQSQSQEEAEKAAKRSLWTSVGGILGAGAAIMAAPAVLASAPIAGLIGTGSAATGIGTGILTGVGSALGSVGGLKGAKEGLIGDKAKRGKIKVDKFFDKQAEEATQSFKDYDKKIAESAKWQAVGSGVFAGLQAGGAFKKAGEAVKKGLNVGQAPTGSTFAGDITKAASDKVNPWGADKAAISVDVTPAYGIGKDAGLSSTYQQGSFVGYGTVANPMGAPPTASRDLFTAIGDYLGKSASQAAIGYGASKLTGTPQNQIINQNQDIQLPDYS